MKKMLTTIILLMPLITNAKINANYEFPVTDYINTLNNDLRFLEACCETDASCCIDFSESVSIDDFKNRVRTVDLFHNGEFRSRMNTIRIKKRLNQTERRYNNRFNEIGKYYSR